MADNNDWINDWPNAINWFEIPCEDFDRARAFYGALCGEELRTSIHTTTMGDEMQMALFPAKYDGVGGAVVKFKEQRPSKGGVLVYLTAGRDLTETLRRIEPAGGKVIVPKTKISDEHGYFALFHDTEGNELGLHSPE